MGVLKITGPVQINANDNDWIDFRYDGTTYAAQITAGVYLSAELLAATIKTVCNAVATGSISSVTVATTTGIITVAWAGSKNGQFLFSSGTKVALGYSANEVMGFPVADSTYATSSVGTYQVETYWLPSHDPSMDTGDRYMQVNGELRTTVDGSSSKRVWWGGHTERKISWELRPGYEIFANKATGADLNKDFETIWRLSQKGYTVRVYDDRDSGTYATYYVRAPSDLMSIGGRPHIDIDWYPLSLELVKGS